MRASSSIAAVALLCRGALAQCADHLAVLAGSQEVADHCASDISSDATGLCSDFLGTTTTFATPSVSQAAVTTTTEFTTSTVTRVVFTTATTETEVVVSTVTTTVAATASPEPIGRRRVENISVLPRASTSATTCPTLTSLPTDSTSSSVISSACSCLGVSPVVSTVSVYPATSTVTESRTFKTTTTITSALVTVTESTTTTSVATVTQNASSDRCSVGYYSGGNGQGNQSENVPATSSQDCCQQCQQKQNCVASVYTGTTCQLLIKTSRLSGAETSDQCPLGIEDYAFGAAGGMVYPGPCGY